MPLLIMSVLVCTSSASLIFLVVASSVVQFYFIFDDLNTDICIRKNSQTVGLWLFAFEKQNTEVTV